MINVIIFLLIMIALAAWAIYNNHDNNHPAI